MIGEGHFGKVLLVRWNNGATISSSSSSTAASSRSSSGSSSTSSGGGRDRRPSATAAAAGLFSSAATIDEGAEEGSREGGYAIGEDVVDKAGGADEAETDAEDVDTDDAEAADATTKANTLANTKPSSSKHSGNNYTAVEDDWISRSGRHGCDRYLAVKEVALHKGTSLPGVLNERQILGVLQEHPFVVTLRCAWRRGNFLYYGLDFLPGADLFELFRRNAIKMDLQSARVYGGQVALALEHLHNHGICYRDLKVRVSLLAVCACTLEGRFFLGVRCVLFHIGRRPNDSCPL